MPAEAARSAEATVVRAAFAPPSERRSVLERAHVGDIEGALGTVIAFDTAPRRTLRRRLATLLAIMGPGGDGRPARRCDGGRPRAAAPWQLFFQQSNVVDKRITPRWLRYERADTLIGTVFDHSRRRRGDARLRWAFGGTAAHGRFQNAGAVAAGLRTHVSPLAGTRFAIALLDASLLGAAAVTLASSYAWGDYFGFKHSLHRGWRDASTFHGTYIAFVALAAMIVLIPGAPLGLITIGVQALAGVLLPSATVFLLLRFRRIDTDY